MKKAVGIFVIAALMVICAGTALALGPIKTVPGTLTVVRDLQIEIYSDQACTQGPISGFEMGEVKRGRSQQIEVWARSLAEPVNVAVSVSGADFITVAPFETYLTSAPQKFTITIAPPLASPPGVVDFIIEFNESQPLGS